MEARIGSLARQHSNKRAMLAEKYWGKYTKNITNKWEKGTLAQLLENEAIFIAQNPQFLQESTTTGAIASFDKFIFPIIRAVWPNLVTNELVSVQPLEGPTGMIFSMDFLAGTTKGNIAAGTPIASARTGFNENTYEYPTERVQGVVMVDALGVATVTFTVLPARPGSIEVTWAGTGTPPARDDGNGGITGGGTTAGTINYTTGALSVTPPVGFTSGTVVASYDYVSEASAVVPELDLSLTAQNVQSRAEKLKTKYSVEAAALMKSQLGLDAEIELMEALAQHIRFSIDNIVINEMFRGATAGSTSFDVNPPSTAIPYFTHQMSLLKVMHSGSNKIFKSTRRGYGNWIVGGVDACTIIESHPLFESAGNLNGPGVVFSGVFAGRWKVFKNPFLTNANGSPFGSTNYLIGYKGNNFFDSGYVFAPWIPFFRTPTIMLDDMVSRIGILSHFGRKLINGLFYSPGVMLNA